jgi:3-oxoacyl-[acyl-carrier-protein] synthase II
MNKPRVVVTGIGVITPFGVGGEQFWSGLLAGASTLAPAPFDASACTTPFAAPVRADSKDLVNLVGDRKRLKLMGRHAQFAVAAAVLAVQDAGLHLAEVNPGRVGVFMGTSHDRYAYDETYRRVWAGSGRGEDPLHFLRTLPNGPAAHTAIQFGARGPNSTILTDGVATAQAVGDAVRVLERGDADVMLAGGADSEVNPDGFLGWQLLDLLSRNRTDARVASRPFDRARDGLILGEGAAVFVLERLEQARGRRIYGEILGYGSGTDGEMLPGPDADGEPFRQALAAALEEARCAPDSLGYLNAHGVSSPLLDRIECRGIRRLFGSHCPPASSIKGAIGYLGTAAPAVDLVACLFALREGLLPPTINLEDPDPECDLDHVANTPRPSRIRTAASVSYGLGGHAVALVVGAGDD